MFIFYQLSKDWLWIRIQKRSGRASNLSPNRSQLKVCSQSNTVSPKVELSSLNLLGTENTLKIIKSGWMRNHVLLQLQTVMFMNIRWSRENYQPVYKNILSSGLAKMNFAKFYENTTHWCIFFFYFINLSRNNDV